MNSIDILRELVRFPTVSRTSNLELIDFVRDFLESRGADVRTVGREKDRVNLWVTIGPQNKPGIVLSGHSDVVPVEGQAWTKSPFDLTELDGRLYGRGTADMKGFLACALACAAAATERKLATPLHLAISYDEEIGCVGVRPLIEDLRQLPIRPFLCWIGEPTSMQIATGHKGKVALKATCIGREAHSALAPSGLNALHIATDFISALRQLQTELTEGSQFDDAYDVPYSTVHVGVLSGGNVVNIVPALAVLDFEIRNIAADDPNDIINTIRARADEIVAPLRTSFPEADIVIEVQNAYPGLDTRSEAAIEFMTDLTGANSSHTKVAFGTEGGLFSKELSIPTIICGPGSMEQGHKPDEFVTKHQMDQCDEMLRRLLNRISS